MCSFLLKNVQSSFIGDSQKLETTQYPSRGAWINKVWHIHAVEYCCCSIPKVLPTLCDPWTVACQASLSLDFPSKNTGVGSHFLLQGIFQTQGSNPAGLPHCRQILYHLSYQRSPSDAQGNVFKGINMEVRFLLFMQSRKC